MTWCLRPELAEQFKKDLIEGTITPEKLNEMSSELRHKFFVDKFGEENAMKINSMFEEKLLLKNQKQGIITWSKKVLSGDKRVNKDIFNTVNKLEKALDINSDTGFLKDLVSKKLGVDIKPEEAGIILELSKELNRVKENYKGGDSLDYGAAEVALTDYVNSLKSKAKQKTLSDYKNPLNIIDEIASNSKAISASLDNSALFRQGWKTMITNPVIWSKHAFESFSDIANVLRGKDVESAVKAKVYGMENSINGNFDRMKIDIGKGEEAYPTSLPERIPGFGILYKASEVAYKSFLIKVRADLANKYIKILESNNLSVVDTYQMESLGKVINSLTGRGNLGRLESAGKTVNNIFFSPKKLKGDIDTLTAFRGQKVSPLAKKIAAQNLGKVIMGTAAVLTTAYVLDPKSVEFDPRSSDFGKIKIGNTRFDMTGGSSSIVTLAARLIPALIGLPIYTKSNGKLHLLNGKEYGAQTGMDVFNSFTENKLSPMFSVIKDMINQKDFYGNPVTFGGELSKLTLPIPFTNIFQTAQENDHANLLLISIADGLGINTNTYSSGKKNNKKSPYLK